MAWGVFHAIFRIAVTSPPSPVTALLAPGINLAIHERIPFGLDLVVRGSLERLTPVLMTALSAGVALVPLLFDAAMPEKRILHPVAVTIFGGLVSATLLDTLLTPVLFMRFGEKPLDRILSVTRESALAAGEPTPARPADAF